MTVQVAAWSRIAFRVAVTWWIVKSLTVMRQQGAIVRPRHNRCVCSLYEQESHRCWVLVVVLPIENLIHWSHKVRDWASHVSSYQDLNRSFAPSLSHVPVHEQQ